MGYVVVVFVEAVYLADLEFGHDEVGQCVVYLYVEGFGELGFEDGRDLGEVDHGGGGFFSFLYSLQDGFRCFFDLLSVSGQFPGGFEDGVDEDVGVYEPHSRDFSG